MWYQYMGWPGNWSFGFMNHWWGWIFPFALLDLLLKGITLWRSAQAKEKWWFVALLVVNSLGILPVIYLLTHSSSKSTKGKKK